MNAVSSVVGVMWFAFECCHLEFHMSQDPATHHLGCVVQHVTLRFRRWSDLTSRSDTSMTRCFANSGSIHDLDRFLAGLLGLRSVIIESEWDVLTQIRAAVGPSGVFGDDNRTQTVACSDALNDAQVARTLANAQQTPRFWSPRLFRRAPPTLLRDDDTVPAWRPLSPFWLSERYKNEWRMWTDLA